MVHSGTNGMTGDNFNLDHIMESDDFDLKHIYSNNLSDEDLHDSPLHYIQNSCKYQTPYEVSNLVHIDKMKSLSCFSLNCRGLSSNWDRLNMLLAEMSNKEFSFDIIGLSEVYSFVDTVSFKIDGYKELKYRTRDRNIDDIKGGVGVFIKEEIHSEDREDLTIFIPHVIETYFTEIKTHQNVSIVIGTIYRPNTAPRADIDVFMKTITDIIETVKIENKQLILLGDFNVDLLKYETHAKTNDFLNGIISQGMIPLITKPTRVTDHPATLTEHIHTNIVNKKITSGIVLTDIADHYGTFCLIENSHILKKLKACFKRSFTPHNIETFKEILKESTYTDIYNATSANTAYKKYLDIFQVAYNTAFPKQKASNKSKYVKQQPWMSLGLLVSSKQKNKLYLKKMKKIIKLE